MGWSRSGIDIDKEGNIYHERSGKILKHWVEDNTFTGDGHHIELSKNEDIEDSYEWREKMIARATEQYNCKDCKSYIEIRFGFWCYENYTGAKRWQLLQEYARNKGLCFHSDVPDRKMYIKKIKDRYRIYPKHCKIFKKKER